MLEDISDFDPTRVQDLMLEIVDFVGTTIIETADATAAGGSESLIDVPVSILGLFLPFAEGYAYFWYLRNVAEGTISGPQGMALAGGATMFLLFGAAQLVTGLIILVYRVRTRVALGQAVW